ncbi:hypothetical protein BT63DRAFT_211301 [Microthyrium microscopicum]|uniref:C2H2-type domain-containing protein n=1 Tax=Microthyrium microscopicum TaxID=703497 RepID=A0A6A6UG55_9PEZI|nr:hypothetical protein BT63DRAFT_211301 [Microthyrium microscopicum]
MAQEPHYPNSSSGSSGQPYSQYSTAPYTEYSTTTSGYLAPVEFQPTFPMDNSQFATLAPAFSSVAAFGGEYGHTSNDLIQPPFLSHTGSPVSSNGVDLFAQPRLSASSESGASVQSTSSSSIGSPGLQPQYQEPWSNISYSGGYAALHAPASTSEMYQHTYQPTLEHDQVKNFVGESPSNSSPNSSVSPAFSSISSTFHSSRSSPIFESRTSIMDVSPGFRAPGLPASASRPSSTLNQPPFASERWQHSKNRRSSLLSNQLYSTQPAPIYSRQQVDSFPFVLPSPFPSDRNSSKYFSSSFSCFAQIFSNSKKTNNRKTDPSILQPLPYMSQSMYAPSFPTDLTAGPVSPHFLETNPTSPPLRPTSTNGRKVKSEARQSPHPAYHPYAYPPGRRQSTASIASRNSSQGSGSLEHEDQDRDRGVCQVPDCGKSFKDLKAHMLTHQLERPEKCPIKTCEYHIKGFARKYDKNRHTLTHYKGTMRHLTSVHNVEQVPPNARRKSPTSRKNANMNQQSGICSTCNHTFPSAQEFYEHLDECVLHVVQQEDPAEAINEKHLSTIAEDKDVQETLSKHNLSNEFETATYDEDEEDDEDEDEDAKTARKAMKKKEGGAGGSWHSNGRVSKKGRPGLTLSRGGVKMMAAAVTSGRKKRKNYPTSWGSSPEKMKMKKRVVCIYDGQRRLWKDDMMLNSDHEVRVPLPSVDGRPAHITDLDVTTMARAYALMGATPEERGPWVPDNIIEPSPPFL